MKTPAAYAAPLRSRAAILAFLATAANSRPGYGLFAFNVKAYSVDLSFDNLAKRARESGELSADVSPRYLAECRELHDADRLYEWAIERARESVTDCDTHRILWDGSETLAEWSFAGRSGGWLVLESFEGVPLRNGLDAQGIIEGMAYPQLRRLYRFIVQCLHDFRREAVKSEIEHVAAFDLFANVCAEVETDEQAADREVAASAEAAERAHWEARDTVTA